MGGLIFKTKFVKINISRHRGVSAEKLWRRSMRRKVELVILGIALIFQLVGCDKDNTSKLSLEHIETELETEKDQVNSSIFVYVCGAVLDEGVYELPAGSRVYEAIQKAGGFTEDAAVTQINQAEVLEDETQLYVPTMEEITNEETKDDGKVNLNSATKEELMTLPGVGDAKADLIIQYREEHGRFQNIEDVMNISGIKEGLFAKIKDNITV